MTSEENREEKFDRQSKQSFEYLGRFVQHFEQMVHAIRGGCLFFLSKNAAQQRLVNIVLHHHVMSANALWDIYRGLITEATNIVPLPDPVAQKALMEILSQTASEFQDLMSARNSILHGTPFIGWAGSGDEDFSSISISKFKISGKGFVTAETPTSVEEFKKLNDRCDRLQDTVLRLTILLQFQGNILANFTKVDGKWIPAKSGP